MSEINLLIDGYYGYGTISIDVGKIFASNSIVYFPAELHLHPIKPLQHFNIDVIQCSLLLENSKISEAKPVHDFYNSTEPCNTRDILFEFMIPDYNIKKSKIDEKMAI